MCSRIFKEAIVSGKADTILAQFAADLKAHHLTGYMQRMNGCGGPNGEVTPLWSRFGLQNQCQDATIRGRIHKIKMAKLRKKNAAATHTTINNSTHNTTTIATTISGDGNSTSITNIVEVHIAKLSEAVRVLAWSN